MIGQRLGSFLIEEKIGAGAMGVVYRALHEKTGKVAAVKVVTDDVTGRSAVPERFEREAEILQAMRHPNIVRFLAVGRSKGISYFAMEYLTGGTVEDLLEKRGPLPWREAVALAIPLCDALHYAHQRSVIHRDLKPSNLLMTEKGRIKLTDFGIAKDLDGETLTATGRTLGTAAYMAPEQIRGDPPVSHKTDLYALGCLMYQMLTGEIPYRGASPVILMNQHLNAKPPRASLKAENLPRALDDLILALMAKDPTKRPWDAEKVRADLEELVAKVDRGEDVPMVFEGGAPARLGGPTGAQKAVGPAADSAIAGETTRGTRSRRARSSASETSLVDRIERYKTAGLVAVLIGGIALAAYLLWPPGAATLYRQAEALMRSEKPSDWREAERRYIAELDRRFPDLYAPEKAAWRDRILLDKAIGRARFLESAALGRVSDPKPGAETDFLAVSKEAAVAVEDGNDAQAERKWQALADALLQNSDPEVRMWGLLARQRAAKVRDDMANRRQSVTALLDRSDRLVQDGNYKEADRLREEVARRFGHVRDLRELIRSRTRIDPAAEKGEKSADETKKQPDQEAGDTPETPEADRETEKPGDAPEKPEP